MAFPTSPTNGQIYKNFKYNSTKGAWSTFSQPDIGYIYHQLPNKPDPQTLWGGTWSNISSTYAGAFFRTEGGSAAAFNSGKQSGQNLSHTHTESGMSANASHTHEYLINIQHSDGSVVAGEALLSGLTAGGRRRYVDATNGANIDHTHTINASGGAENRPDNYSIRIWERTA